MGIGKPEVILLAAASKAGVSYESTLLVGHQRMHALRSDVEQALGEEGMHQPIERGDFADALFFGLGASSLSILDVSAYEGADLIVDLNEPVPAHLHSKFSCVIESGTLEHVYNAPVAIGALADLVAPGGHLLISSPCDGWAGHGFYQFSPEFFFRSLSPDRGFDSTRIWLHDHERRRWFRVTDPAAAGRRTEFGNGRPNSLYVVARRGTTGATSLAFPIQSDYATAWTGTGTIPTPADLLKRWYRPAFVRRPLLRLRRRLINRVNGGFDPRFFEPVPRVQIRSGSFMTSDASP